MKKILKLAFLSATALVLLAGCTKDYSSDIQELDSRITVLDKKVSDLEAAIKDGKVIKSVESVAGGIKITLSNDEVYTITNGKDGAKGDKGDKGERGEKGEKGDTPTVTIKDGYWYINGENTNVKAQGTDGKTPTVTIKDGYWYINGENTNVKAKGEDGTPGSVVTIDENGYWCIDGVSTGLKAQGPKGEDGHTPAITINGEGFWCVDGVATTVKAQGEDGHTPAITINGEGFWCIDGVATTVKAQGEKGDTGATGNYWKPDVENNKWVEYTSAGVATGETIDQLFPEGTVTAVWANGKLELYGVEDATDGKVVINCLSPLKSIAIIPDTYFDGLPVITAGMTFYAKEAGTENSGIIANMAGIVSCRLNPAQGAEVSTKVDDWKFINRTVLTRALGDKEDLLKVTNVRNLGDEVEVQFYTTRALENPVLDHGQDNEIIALQTTTAEGENITSDYAYVQGGSEIDTYNLVHANCWAGNDYVEYRSDYISTDAECDSTFCDNASKDCIFDLSTCSTVASYQLARVDLNAWVKTAYTFGGSHSDLSSVLPEGSQIKYKFALYSNGNDYTAHNAAVTIDTDGVMKLASAFIPAADGNDCDALDKTPLVQIIASLEAGSKTYALDTAYMKIAILGKHSHTFVEPVDFKLNPDYILGSFNTLKECNSIIGAIDLDKEWNEIGAVRVKGQNGELVSGIVEHFKEYSLPAIKDGTISFKIANFDATDVCWNEPNPSTVDYVLDNTTNTITFDKDQWDQFLANSKAEDQAGYLKLLDETTFHGDYDVLIEVTQTCETSHTTKVGYYYVVFESPTLSITASLADAKLYTFASGPDSFIVDSLVTIKDAANKAIFTYDKAASQFKLTPYATEKYGATLTGATVEVYSTSLDYDLTGKDTQVSFGGRIAVQGTNTVTWNNKGTDLLENKRCYMSVNITVIVEGAGSPYSTTTNRATITVVNTADSRAHESN